jgi:hypothetical protein
MTRAKVRSSILRHRILQQRGLLENPSAPPSSRFTPVTPNNLKTTAMLLKELDFNMDIGVILKSGVLHHNPKVAWCGECILCVYGIQPSTASKWRKRLGIGNYHG